MTSTLISVRNLKKEFPRPREKFVIEVDSLNVEAGSVQVLMGPNGSGKSTLALLLTGALMPDTGDVKVCGSLSPRTVAGRRCFSYLPEGNFLYPGLSGDTNVRTFIQIASASYGQEPKRLLEKALNYLELLNLSWEDLHKPVRLYSVGMRRKVELAITLAVDVPLYILDMPTSGLDQETRARFFNLVQNKQQNGAGFLLSTHIPDEARFCDRIWFIQKGRIIASAHPSEVRNYIRNVVVMRFNPLHKERLQAALQDVKSAVGNGEARFYNVNLADVNRLIQTANVEIFEIYETYPHVGDLYAFLTKEIILEERQN